MSKNKNGWDRDLGSKKSQGIITPSQPKQKLCGCWYRDDKLYQWCVEHYFKYQISLEEAINPDNKGISTPEKAPEVEG